jgi:hypothetical protein
MPNVFFGLGVKFDKEQHKNNDNIVSRTIIIKIY